MNKIFRIVTTVLIAVGFAYLFLYLNVRDEMKFSLLQQPSYSQISGARSLLYAGICTVIITLLGSFFSWFKKMDTPKKELPNAINAKIGDIDTWISGSSLGENTMAMTEMLSSGTEKTEILESATEIVGGTAGTKAEEEKE